MNTIRFPMTSRIPDDESPLAARRFPQAPLASIHRCQSRTRILHADDDRCILRASQILLGRAGYDVDTVADGEEAWGALQSVPYHLLITDHQMPQLTGAELIRRVRASPHPLPIVLASSSVLESEREGCDAVLRKPFTVRELIETVRRVLLGPPRPHASRMPQPFLEDRIPG